MNPIISPKNKPLPEHIRKGEYYETNTRGKPEEGKLYALTGKQGQPSIAAGNTWAESEVKSRKEDLANYNKDDVKMFTEVETAYDFAMKILSHYEFYYLDKKPSYDNAANFGCDVLTFCKRIQARKGE
tara:strand:+ start:25878 stop:26261 length:384 start_codon:yes stop_codon:yes gene_type:complete